MAVDGNFNPDKPSGSCSSTDAIGPDPEWWQVDLLTPHVIHYVTVTNRGDAVRE